MKTSLILVGVVFGCLFQGHKPVVVNYDGEVVLCYRAAEKKHWQLVEKEKYRKIENYLIEMKIEEKTVLVSFDPKLAKEDVDKGTSLSSIGLGYEYLVERGTRKILKISTIP